MSPEPNLNQRVKDDELTEEEAEILAESFYERERDIAWDRKAEKQIRENESKS